MQVLHLHAVLQQILGQILRHALGEGRDQHTLITLNAHANLLEQIINLPLGRLDHNLRVNQAGRANNLLHITISLRQLILTRSRRKVNRLTDTLQELLPLQRAVIHRRRQTETVLHQGALTGHIALIHGTNLRDRHVRLVNNQQEIIREIIQQTVRGATGGTTVNVARVVLNAVAEAHLLHHFQVVGGAHAQTLRLQQFALGFEGLQALAQLILNGGDSLRHTLRASNIVACGEDVHLLFLANHLAGQRVQGVNRLNLITEELNADRVLLVHGDDFDGIAAHTERAAVKVHIVTRVLHRHELAQQLVAVNLLTATQSHHLLNVLFGRAQAVNAGHGRNHHHVTASQQGVRRRVAQTLHLLIDGGVLLNERIGLRHVRLRLVVVVVGDEILHRVIRQQLAQLIRQLRRQSLILHEHQGRTLHRLNQPGCGRGLTGTGSAHQHNVLLTVLHTLGELGDSLRLVTGRLEGANDLKGGNDAINLGCVTHVSILGESRPMRARIGHPFLLAQYNHA